MVRFTVGQICRRLKLSARISVARALLGCASLAILFLTMACPNPAAAITADSPEWQALVKAAQKEGALSVAGYGSRAYAPVYDQFSRKFGIKVVVSYAGGREHADRILAERRAGVYAVDVGHVGANTVNRRLIPAGAIAPIRSYLVLDEVSDPSNWYGDRLWFVDSKQKYVFAYAADFENAFTMFINPNLVKEADLKALRSPDDLLSAKWAHKVVALSPMLGQSGNSYFRYSLLPKPFGTEWMEKFVKSKGVDFVTSSRLIEDGLAGGKYAFAVFPNGPPLIRMQKQGLPVRRIEHVFKGAAGIMTAGAPTQEVQVYDKAPHPNAAKLFVNWLLSKEGQTYIEEHVLNPPNPRNSLRKDVPKTHVDPTTLPQKGIAYYAIDLLPKYQSRRRGTMKKIQGWYKAAHQ